MNIHTISKQLIALRQSKGWTQEDLSEKLLISRQAVSKWETGVSLPTSAVFVQAILYIL